MLLFLNEIESKKIGGRTRKRALYECDNCKKNIERTFEKNGNIIQNGCSNCKKIKLKPIQEYIAGLKIVKDLGLNKEKKPKREAVFMCFCGILNFSVKVQFPRFLMRILGRGTFTAAASRRCRREPPPAYRIR